MRKLLLTTASLIFANISSVYAQDVNSNINNPVSNPNSSSYPASNQINSVPNEPDHTFGNDSSVHNIPADDIPVAKKGLVNSHSTSSDSIPIPQN